MNSHHTSGSKINVRIIIDEHFKTLVNASTNRTSAWDYFYFIIIPFIVACLIGYFVPKYSKDVNNTLITILSIFIGLLINVVVLVFDILRNEREKGNKIVVLRETVTNICYTILVSFITVIIALFTYFENCIVKTICTIGVYFLMTHVMLTLLMILKRMYLLFTNDIDVSTNDSN